MCALTGIVKILSIYTIFRWPIYKIVVKSAFLQTGDAERDVDVLPPRESSDRSHYWLPVTPSYGLVKPNEKWQILSDSLLKDIFLYKLAYVSQLFYMKDGNYITAIVIKIVEDILLDGGEYVIDSLIRSVENRLKFGTVAHVLGLLRYYGLNIL